MRKIFRNISKWVLRVILGTIALLLLLLLLFYLFRGKITDKALAYVNELQPGEVMFEKLNLRPFMDFPDVSLRLREVRYLAPHSDGTGNETLPVMAFDDIYVSMDVVQLIRGTYMISEVRLADGVINYLVGADSVSNVEKALGTLFGGEQTDTVQQEAIMLDLQQLEISGLTVNYEDQPGHTSFTILVNKLESGFSYSTDLITASVNLNSEIQMARLNTVTLDKPKSVSFSSAVRFDQVQQFVTLDRSMLELQDALFEIEGVVNLDARTLDLDFSAVNTGIDLLNFLLSGVLNMDAIAQIGDGSIRLEGSAKGSYSKQLPLMKVDVTAADLGFRVHSIDQSVTGIAFDGFITNGSLKDLSEAEVHLNDLHVDFPKGSLDAEIHLSDYLNPYADISLNGDADLSVINEIIGSESVKEMRGNLRLEGDIQGSVDKQAGTFQNSGGMLKVFMDDLGFTVPGYQVQQLNGELQLQETILGLREIELVVNDNRMQLEGEVQHLLPWLMESDVDPSVSLAFSADELDPGKLLNDTAMIMPVRDLGFRLALSAGGQALRGALDEQSIPELVLSIEDLTVTLPGYAPISEGNMTVQLASGTAWMKNLQAQIGESDFTLDASLTNYDRMIRKDSSASLQLEFDLAAGRLLASDLLTIDDQFSYLPPQFAAEEIQDFRIKGKVETTVYELLKDSVLPDFILVTEEMHWRLKEYPNAFSDLDLDIELRDSLMDIRHFAGSIGESNFNIRASLLHLMDTTRTISGEVQLSSGLLDIDRLLAYSLLTASGGQQGLQPPAGNAEVGDELTGGVSAGEDPNGNAEVGGEEATGGADFNGEVAATDTVVGEPLDLSQIEFPDLALDLDVKELRMSGNVLKNMDGRLATKPYKIIYFDQFYVQSVSGGSILLDGQFNVSDPALYMLSANIEIDTLDVSDFDLQIAVGDSVYSLEDNFNGLLSADGLAEFFLNPNFSINTDYSTAMFNVRLINGRVQNFTPLQALAKYTGNKNLDNVEFGLLRNSFTLMNGTVHIPLMNIESTLGLLLLEGEQYLDGNFLYLARVPVSLVRGTAWNMLFNNQNRKPEEGEVQEMSAQKFLLLTISGKDGTEEVKVGDKRDQFR